MITHISTTPVARGHGFRQGQAGGACQVRTGPPSSQSPSESKLPPQVSEHPPDDWSSRWMCSEGDAATTCCSFKARFERSRAKSMNVLTACSGVAVTVAARAGVIGAVFNEAALAMARDCVRSPIDIICPALIRDLFGLRRRRMLRAIAPN